MVSRIVIDPDGFCTDTGEVVRWTDLGRIGTFKRDVFAHDLFCLWFERGVPPTLLVVDEMAAGFDELRAAMDRRLPGLRPDWYGEVMLPPFVENAEVIWSRGVAGDGQAEVIATGDGDAGRADPSDGRREPRAGDDVGPGTAG